MKKLATFIAILVVLAIAAPSLAQQWAGRGRIQGVIKDEAGAPIEGATITLNLNGSGPKPTTTDKKGHWKMLGLAGGTWGVLIQAPGYVDSEGSVKVYESGPSDSIEIKLRKPTAQEMAPGEPTAEQKQNAEAVDLIKQGNASLEAKQYAPAREAYEKAIALLAPEHHPAILTAIANSYYAEGKANEAIDAYKRALALTPDDPQLLQSISTLLVAEGREKEAEPYLAKLPQGTKMDPNALLNVGIEAYNANDMTKALTYFDRVVSENPELPDGYYYRGLIYLNQQKNDVARADLEKFLALAPDHAHAEEAREFLKYLKK